MHSLHTSCSLLWGILKIGLFVVQSLSHVRFFATPRTAALQAPLSTTIFRSLLMSIESVMLFNHLVFCCPLLLLPSIFLSIRVFSSESALCIRWPKYSASASVLPVNIQGWFPLGLTGLISFQSRGLSRVFSSTTVQKAPILWHSDFFMVHLSHLSMTMENHSLDYMDLCRQSDVSAF